MAKQYSALLIRLEGDEQEVLVDEYLDADDFIELMVFIKGIKAKQPKPEPSLDEYAEPAAPAAPDEPTKKPKKTCGNCGQPGHNKSTCEAGKVPTKPEKKPKTLDVPFFYEAIRDMLSEGMTEGEVYENYRDRITNTEFREAVTWAQEQLAE